MSKWCDQETGQGFHLKSIIQIDLRRERASADETMNISTFYFIYPIESTVKSRAQIVFAFFFGKHSRKVGKTNSEKE